MWADNYWLFHDSSETLACVVNDIFEKLLSWIPCDRTSECVLQIIHDGSGGLAARRKGAV